MFKPSFLYYVNRIGAFSEKHAPELLTGLGVTGMLSTIALTVMATIKSVSLLEREKENRIANNDRDDDENIVGLIKVPDSKNPSFGHYRLPVKDAVQIIWKPCLPAAITGVASVVCLISANAVSAKRSAALTAAYAISETAFRDYRGKVVEMIGNKKEDEIHTAVVQDKINKNPVTNTEVIFTGDGTMLCYDVFTGRYFQSDRNSIERAVNEVNRIAMGDGSVTLNEFYDFVGLEHTKLGDALGWEARYGDLIEARFSSHLASDGRPCLAVSFNIPPRYEYSS